MCILAYQKGSKSTAPVKAEAQKAAPPIEVPSLSLDELKEKTDNFGSKALIGEGSYGRVYYAILSNGKAVAVKKLDVSAEPESNVEFLTQVCAQSFLISFMVSLPCFHSKFNLFFTSQFLYPSLYLIILVLSTLGFHGFKTET